MKKRSLISLIFVLAFVFALSACGSKDNKDAAPAASASPSPSAAPTEAAKGTITYQSENGPVEVPANPQRVVLLSSTFAGNVMALDVKLVGVDKWAMDNPRFKSKLTGVTEVSDENVEQVMGLNPDLIIGLSTIKNYEKFKQIAPTVTFTYGKLDYLTQHLEIAKLLNKEKQAQTWIEDFKKRAQKAGDEIRAKIGQDATVTVVENFDKQLYVFGSNWARGTEILYQEMKLKMPKKVEENALKPGFYALSPEALPEFVGDYLIVSQQGETAGSFFESETFKNIPAVKNNHVFTANAKEFFFNDPLTLELQLEFFIKSFLGK